MVRLEGLSLFDRSRLAAFNSNMVGSPWGYVQDFRRFNRRHSENFQGLGKDSRGLAVLDLDSSERMKRVAAVPRASNSGCPK